jgi:hypothetical protein
MEAILVYERLSAEMQVRGRLRETLYGTDQYLRLRNVTSTPLRSGVQPVQGAPEGFITTSQLGALWLMQPDMESAEEAIQKNKRWVLFQAETFIVKGCAEFPVHADPEMHRELILKMRFFPLKDVEISLVDSDQPPIKRYEAWVNRDLMVGLFLG